MSSPTVKELYDCYDVVNNASEDELKKKVAYETILKGVNGEEKEKRLASQFIANFFKLFPQLYEESFNKLLDLCEDDNVVIRKQVIQYLSVIAKSVPDYIPKIADTLIQMLITDDNTEVSLIYSALNTVIKLNSKVAFEAIFNQLITQLDESNELINTFAFKYLNEKFSTENDFKPEIETLVETHGTKLLTKLSGKDEFPLLIGILSSLKSNSTLVGRQKLLTEISEQAKLIGKINTNAKYTTLLLNCKQAVKLLSKNVHADDLLMVLLDNLTSIVKLGGSATELNLYELLRCLVDFTNRSLHTDTSAQVSKLNFKDDEGLKCVNNVFQLTYEQLPAVAEEVTPEILAAFSDDTKKLKELECFLLATYNLCKFRPEAMGLNDDTLKQFKLRLQFLGRYNQIANKKATDSVAKLPKADQGLGENREQQLLVKVTANLQILIRELFKAVPTFKTPIAPSWSAPVETAVSAIKRLSSNNDNPSAQKFRPNRGNNFNPRRRR